MRKHTPIRGPMVSDAARRIIRTSTKGITITEAHPFHGDVLIDNAAKGLQGPHRTVQAATAPREVYEKYDARCPLCRAAHSQSHVRIDDAQSPGE